MKSEIKIPQVGESINEVTIGQWLKADGDYIKMDEAVCEIESEKATLEIQADQAGQLKILIEEGETVSVGDKIAEIDTEVPGGVDGGQRKNQEVKELQEDKEESEIVEIEESSDPKSDNREDKSELKEERITTSQKSPKITPLAAKLLQEAGISPDSLKGDGFGDRITKDDAQEIIESRREGRGKKTVSEEKKEVRNKAPRSIITGEPESPLKSGYPVGKDERIERRQKMSTLRKTIANRLVAAKNETAMLTTFNEIDMSAILEARSRYKELFEKKHNVRLGFMSFFVRAVCIALKDFPMVNAKVEEDEIIYYDFCDISIAVSTPKGLVVPVVFDADKLTLAEIEAAVSKLAQKARDNKLTIDEMTGGTFSITNGGVFGSLLSTPIINAPQSAILGMHKIQERPVAVDGQVVVKPMMYVSLSYDHRIIDGRESVKFLVRVKELLEDPARMLLDS